MFFRKQKSAGNDNRLETLPPTLIGAGTVVDGNIDSEGEVRIEGTLRGSLKARNSVIAAGGTVEGEISADDIIVQGRVRGPLRALHVHLMDGAVVEGDITSDTIAIDTGARLSGAVWQAEAEQPPALTHNPGPALFSGSLWPNRGEDDGRPIRTVKPRASGGSFR